MQKELVKTDLRVGCKIFMTNLVDQMKIPPHYHNEIELCYILSGTKDQRIDGKLYHVIPGDLLLMNHNEVHSMETHGNNRSIVLLLDYTYLHSYCLNLDDYSFDINVNFDSKQKIIEIFQEIARFFVFENQDQNNQIVIDQYSSSDYSYIYVKSKVEEIIYYLLRYHLVQQPNLDKKVVNRKHTMNLIFSYINENYTRQITLDEIAEKCNYSPTYVSKLFKEYCGVNLFEYLTQFRMEKCLNDLKETDDSIKEISEKHGFQNYKSFQKMFKKMFNQTPGEYRKRMT